MEEELRTHYPDSKVKLVKGDGGIFDVTVDGKLIYSKQRIGRFPNDGEVTGLVKKEKE